MRDGAPDEVYSSVAGWRPHVTSYQGQELRAESVPIIGGRAVGAVSQEVPESVTIQVPRFTPNLTGPGRFDWMPGKDPYHPLARYGQHLQVAVEVESSVTGANEAGRWSTRIGTYLITDWDSDGSTVQVTGAGLLERAREARFKVPHATTGATLEAEFRRMLYGPLSVVVDGALTDRKCPDMSFGDDRIDGLYKITDAWPARLRTDPFGVFQILPPLPDSPTPVISLTDGDVVGFAGEHHRIVIGTRYADSRQGVYNLQVARGNDTDANEIPSVYAFAEVPSGPLAPAGVYGPVTTYSNSPLHTSTGICQRSAAAQLAAGLRPTQSIPIECAPDNRIDLDDPVQIISQGVRSWGYVTGYDLPLTVADGPMRLDVAIAAA